MSLIDIYLYYNRLRGSDLITPDDLLQSARLLSQSPSSLLELREGENGMKIVQLKIKDEDADYKKYCYEPILKRPNGLSLEDLVKDFSLSLLVARDKLERHVRSGRLAVDSSLEGTRYFINDILTCEL